MSESIVSWMPPLVTHREEQAPMGACSRLTAWKCPRGGLDARRRAGWKIGCGGAVGNAIGPCRDTGALRGTGRSASRSEFRSTGVRLLMNVLALAALPPLSSRRMHGLALAAPRCA